jgi:hypothetical protein
VLLLCASRARSGPAETPPKAADDAATLRATSRLLTKQIEKQKQQIEALEQKVRELERRVATK